MGLRDMLRAIREYPAALAELRRTQQTLERSEQTCAALRDEAGERANHERFLARQLAAVQTALVEFCPRLSSLEDMKRFYDTISPSVDPQGFTLYHMAEKLTGIDVSSFFPYEDNRGLFAEADGRQLLRWLRQHYPRKETAQDPQFFKRAYKDIQRFMEANGFEAVSKAGEKAQAVVLGDPGQG